MAQDDRSHSSSYSPHKGRNRGHRHRSHHRSRSESPGSDYDYSRNRDRDRDRSSDREQGRLLSHRTRPRIHSRDYHSRTHRHGSPFPELPYNARHLTKYDLEEYYDLFADYLDIQKELAIEELDKAELKGRFKSFIGHWNRGELAKGWYDPVRRKQKRSYTNNETAITRALTPQQKSFEEQPKRHEDQVETSSEEDVVGPVLPGHDPSKKKLGVTLPTIEDLDLQREQADGDAQLACEQLRFDRKLDRKLQKERLEDLVPRADPGSRERRLEKKKDINEKMRSYREKSPGASLEVGEDVLMGGGSDSFKAMKAAKDRKKNERELRKEAMLRQRIEEREARLQRHREKEEKTVMMLKAMAETSTEIMRLRTWAKFRGSDRARMFASETSL